MEHTIYMYMAKTKALISCAVTAQLICAFAFAYADCWFSLDMAQIINIPKKGAQLIKCHDELWHWAQKYTRQYI